MNPYYFIVTLPKYIKVTSDRKVHCGDIEELKTQVKEYFNKKTESSLKELSENIVENQIRENYDKVIELPNLGDIDVKEKQSNRNSDIPEADQENLNCLSDFFLLDEKKAIFLEDDNSYIVDVVKMISELLDELGLEDLLWTSGIKENKYQVTFSVPTSRVEFVMRLLINKGCSTDYGTIRVLPIDIVKPDLKPSNVEGVSEQFMKGAKSRIVMDQVISSVKSGAELNFDYYVLLICAAVIAGIGLASNSAVAVIASMLISPLMGPILSFTFGAFILDRNMIIVGLRNELFSLFLCIFVGFLLGSAMSPFGVYYGWPTPEMRSRGQWDNLILGICVAAPSGAGVALSILGNNAASLVGVAISASLLPPAVNAGLNWAYALIGPHLHQAMAGEQQRLCARLGGVSLLLTVANIICIFLSGIVVFKVKEVVPVAGKSEFWKENLSSYRSHVRPLGTEADEVARVARNARDITSSTAFKSISTEGQEPSLFQKELSTRITAEDIFKHVT
ncbi:uncharacterized protein LOC135145191 isoform X2 [Zophobas morio]|uniref:uncharacterized protein LOC135145191 isoform X2 n=1 Tax=Zophobas morio TaxID=2755281 RepID=UPI003083B559